MGCNNNQDIIYEPVIYDNIPQWLCVTKKEVFPIKRSVGEILNNPEEPEIRPSFEIRKQGLWECNRCGATIESNPDSPKECYKDQEGCGRVANFKLILGVINPDQWILPEWRDIPPIELDMLGTYDEMLGLIRRLLVFSSDIEYKIYTLWIISTWKLEAWDSVGFPIFIGMPNSGKSRALRIISKLGYRAPKASGISADVIPRLTHYHRCTILIDEAHNKLNPRTESGSKILDFIKDSYKQGSVKMVCDNNDQTKIVTYKNFGFKAIAGEKTFQTGLLSRGLVFWMEKDTPEISKLSYVEEQFKGLRPRLLNYRFKTDEPPDLGNDFILKGRTREIFESIIATGIHIGVKVGDIIEYAQNKEEQDQEALRGTLQYDILAVIKQHEENPKLDDAPDRILTDKILEDINWEVNKDNRQNLGYALKNMGIETKRTGEGRAIFYRSGDNENRLRRLYKRYQLCQK